ncbi:MAG TPA: ABC transporter ATP-binding protein [Candidatus Stackebrandtia excrementipullorum]|nr:ABC transporter ATP-binding protein [Candidatus Stackebrandtia excrementipullorum]
MNEPSAAKIEDVSWTYDGSDAPVLSGLNLTVEPGRAILLCGPSGSGKSTALRLLNGLIPHLHKGQLAGTVELFGDDVRHLDWDELGRATGSVWQHPFRQFFTDRVVEEIAFGLENRGEPPPRIRERIDDLLTQHDLTSIRHSTLRHLSSGRQQQVAALAAIAHRPRLLLLDEPTANLAAEAVTDFVAGLARLRNAGVTIVVAEHRIAPFLDLVDEIVAFGNGRVKATWTVEKFRRLSDSDLTNHGLRPVTVSTATSTPIAARGASIVGSSDDADSTGTGGLVLNDIVCSHGRNVVLDIDRAHLPAGRVTAVCGPNGAGKTTLARVLSGLLRHRGTVEFAGRPVTRANRPRLTTLVPQEVQRQLYGETVHSELDLGPAAVAPERRNALLKRLDLDDVGERHPLSLSGGQQQRLAVAVSVLGDRPVVVLDEPGTGVDARHLTVIAELVTELAEAGKIVILISHDRQLLGMTADHELTIQPPR